MKKTSLFHSLITIMLALAVSLPSASLLAKGKGKQVSELAPLKYKSGDEQGNDLKALTAEIFIASQEDKAIQQINKLIKKYKNTQLEPDLLLRLGELYMRRSKTDRFLEVHRGSEEIVNFAPKIVKSAASKKQVLNAIDIYDQIERRFPHYEKLDVVIYNNAFSNQQINNDVKAEKKYLNLVTNYSNSPLVPDGHLALGEIQFKRHNFKNAYTHFDAIRKYPDSQVYPYGLYKAGWTQYNLRDAKAGLKELEAVIQYGRFVKEQGIDARLDLRKEALLDMALFYEDVYPSKDAYSYFKQQTGELDISPVILRLSDLYKRHSRHQDVKIILSEYIKNHSTSNYIPIAYVELMDASEKMKKRKDVITLLEKFYDTCLPNSSWAKAQDPKGLEAKDNPLAQFAEDIQGQALPYQVCSKVFNKMALGYANKWLKYWQKENTVVEYADVAEQAFSIYLKSDGQSDESSRARFVYSELLFKRNKFRLASEQYAITGRLTKDKTIGHDSRYYAILALEKAVGDKWSDKDENSYRTLAAEYLTKNLDGKYRLDVEFKTAFIAYEKGRYDEAGPTFLRLGNTYPNEDKGLKSQDLYLDTLNLKKDYVVLRDYSLSLRAKAKGERIDKLTKIYEEAYFLIIQGLEEKGNFKAAIQEYVAFAKANPNSKLTQKALWNTTLLYYRSGDLMGGASSSVAYYEKYKDTKEGLDSLIKAAQTYESIGQLPYAADTLVLLANVDQANKTKWTVLAADFYLLSNNIKAAKPLYETIRKSGDTQTSFRALEQLEKIAKREGNSKLQVALLKDIIETGHQPQASVAAVYFVEEAYNEKRYDDAFNMAKKIISQEKVGASKNALARARIVQARILDKEFRSQSVKSKLERVQTVLTLKTEKLSKAQIAYQSAANYGDSEVSVQAYRELADCYLHYSDSLRTMPIPTGLPEAEGEAFRAEMDKLAIPMEEKGIDTKIQAFNVARELGVHDSVMLELQNEMKKLNQQVVKSTNTVRLQPAGLVLPRFEGAGT
jgi:cellulose synthase operon protein C